VARVTIGVTEVSIASWMYVSQSMVDPEQHDLVLNRIVDAARRKNEQLDITGCLISARTRFAQILEGPADSVAELRRCISDDYRHFGVTTIDVGQLETRRFSEWSLAYAGPSIFVERITEEMLTHLATSRGQEPINALLRLMEDFAFHSRDIPPTRH
jgi:Sensors of blue-light using FAD